MLNNHIIKETVESAIDKQFNSIQNVRIDDLVFRIAPTREEIPRVSTQIIDDHVIIRFLPNDVNSFSAEINKTYEKRIFRKKSKSSNFCREVLHEEKDPLKKINLSDLMLKDTNPGNIILFDNDDLVCVIIPKFSKLADKAYRTTLEKMYLEMLHSLPEPTTPRGKVIRHHQRRKLTAVIETIENLGKSASLVR